MFVVCVCVGGHGCGRLCRGYLMWIQLINIARIGAVDPLNINFSVKMFRQD